MKTTSLLAGVFAIALFAGVSLATDMTISTNTTWTGTVTIDGKITVTSGANITVQPGTTLNFTNSSASLTFSGGNPPGAFTAQGTAAQPIYITGSGCGQIAGAPNKGVTLDHCVISGMGTSSTDWFNVNPQSGGLSITNSTITNCGPFDTNGKAGVTVSGCTITNMGYMYLLNAGAVVFDNNKVNGMGAIRLHTSVSEEAANNVIVNAEIWSDGSASVSNISVHDNYIHALSLATQYCLQGVNGQIYNNVVRGGTWTTGFCGGHVYNNVIEALTAAEVATRGDSTHEQLNDYSASTVIEHNIVLNNTMGSFMTASSWPAMNCIIRNNTFDQRTYVGTTASAPIYLNHLGGSAANMNVRNNLFLRTGRIYNETSVANGISYVDYNCWAGRDTTDGFSGSSSRFVNVLITGKTEGDDGFGMHDVTLPTLQAGFNTSSVVQNAGFVDPYTDAQMLAGTYTTSQLLALYQQAYTPVAGSSIIDAGSPADSSDPLKIGSRIDIGAIEAPLPVATYLPGDFNKDHVVDYHDYLILEGSFGKSGMTWADGDANNDSLVDYHDYIVLEQNFGKTAPEPVTLSLLAVGAVALLRRRV